MFGAEQDDENKGIKLVLLKLYRRLRNEFALHLLPVQTLSSSTDSGTPLITGSYHFG